MGVVRKETKMVHKVRRQDGRSVILMETRGPVRLEPPHNGTILRIVEFLPRAVCARETCLRGVTPAES
jgi:hypothetical protein